MRCIICKKKVEFTRGKAFTGWVHTDMTQPANVRLHNADPEPDDFAYNGRHWEEFLSGKPAAEYGDE